MNATTLGEKVPFERERRANASKCKTQIAVQYRDDGISGFSDYEWEDQPRQADEYDEPSGDEDNMDEGRWGYHRSLTYPQREDRARASLKGANRQDMKTQQPMAPSGRRSEETQWPRGT